MKQLKLYLSLLIISFLLFTGCKKENMGDCFKSTGKVSQETRALEPFTKVDLNRRINLILIEDSVDFAVAEAGENLLSSVITDVSDGKLTIRNENRCNWMRSYKVPVNVYLHYTRLNHIVMYGSSIITNRQPLKQDSLLLEFRNASGSVHLSLDNKYLGISQHTGASDVTVSGQTGELSVYMASLGTGNYSDLLTDYVYVRSKSAATCRVYSEGAFDLFTDADGIIYYQGNGIVSNKEENGNGEIIKVY